MYLRLVLSFLLIVFLGSCATLEIASGQVDQEVIIDGSSTEWSSNINFFKEENVGIAFKNDNTSLYMCLMTSDRMRMMDILRRGLVVWFDTDDRAKTFGVKFPIPDMKNLRPQMFRPDGEQPFDKSHDEMITKLISDQRELQVINEDNYSLNLFPIETATDFDAALGFNNDRFVYELKVPLNSTDEKMLSLNSAPGDIVSVNVVSGELKFERPSTGQRPGPGMGNRSGGMEGIGGKRPMGGAGGLHQSLDELDLELDVQLAAAN